MIARPSMPKAMCASLTMLLAGAAGAAAETHYIQFNVYNARPNGEVVTGWIVNQNISIDVPSVGGRQMQPAPFETSGYEHSTGHYDVRIVRKGDTSHQYCDYHATAMYQGRQGWFCSVYREGTSNGAICSGGMA